MITLIAGMPKSGKSYEAVKYHILVALSKGRKVVTNLPLFVDEISKLLGFDVSSLVSIVDHDYKNFTDSASKFPFSKPDHYTDLWRNHKGQGPLYVIDEAHFSLPRTGTDPSVKKFFTMHGHAGVDILLLTQFPRQIDKDVLDLIEVVYRTIKNTALGSSSTYTKKVQAGYRGAVVNTTQRTYDPSIFPLYKAFTASESAVDMDSANDIKPIWKHWSFIGAAIFLGLGIPFFIYTMFTNNPLSPKTYEAKTVKPSPVQAVPKQQPTPQKNPTQTFEHSDPVDDVQIPETPFGRVQLHIAGFIQSKDKTLYQFVASQNGQAVFSLSHNDLVFAGYFIKPNGSCNAELIYKNVSFFVICDAPRVGVSSLPSIARN